MADEPTITEADAANVDSAIAVRLGARDEYRNNPVGLNAAIEAEKAAWRAQYGYTAPAPLTPEQKLQQRAGINYDPSQYYVTVPPHLRELPDGGTNALGALREATAKMGMSAKMGGETFIELVASIGAQIRAMSRDAQKQHFDAQENACERLFKSPEGYKAAQAEAAKLLRSIGTDFGNDLANSRSVLTSPQVLSMLVGHARLLKATRK
ncbi:MAG: hypothetical protein JSR78_15205 [Proteobacteria bacterium]|nr:hypothetical protein [Pseudomonadota bacterium]